jgi:DNA polymerase-3 subunit beta
MLLLKTERNGLLEPLQSVCGIVERRHTLPILSNVLIERSGEKLTLFATDVEIQVRNTVPVPGEGESAAVTVGARKLQDILRALPESTEVSLVFDDKRLVVRCGRSRFTLQTLPAADYPRMIEGDTEQARVTLTQKRFRRVLALVQYAMAQQDIRYYLNGLLLVLSGKQLLAVATDGHRLAYASENVEEELPRVDFILPRKTVLELSRLLADSDEALDIRLSGNLVKFQFGHIELVSKLIDGKFPDYERVIPQSHTKVLRLSRLQFLMALQRIAILTNEKFRGARLVLADGTLKIISSNAEQEEAQEEIEVGYAGEALDVGFNVTYLLDVLNNISAEEIECHLADANSSALITIPGNAAFKYVVMPMRI